MWPQQAGAVQWGLMSQHIIRFSPLGLQQLWWLLCTTRARKARTQLASLEHSRGERRSRGQKVETGGGRNIDLGLGLTQSAPLIVFGFSFWPFPWSTSFLKGPLGLDLQHMANNGGKRGQGNEGQMKVDHLACDKPGNNCLLPVPSPSLKCEKVPPAKRPPIPLSPGHIQEQTDSMLD